MAPSHLETFKNRNTLHELRRINSLSAQVFDCLLFPKKSENHESVLSEHNIEEVVRYWQKVAEGFKLTVRRDDPNYDPGMHDGKFAEIDEVDEVDDVLEQLGFNDPEGTSQVQSVDPTIIPTVRHTVITFGLINKMPRLNIPYANEFGQEAIQFWGKALTVSRVRIMTETLATRANNILYHGIGTNYDILPLGQCSKVGSELSTRIVRQAYYSEPYVALDPAYFKQPE